MDFLKYSIKDGKRYYDTPLTTRLANSCLWSKAEYNTLQNWSQNRVNDHNDEPVSDTNTNMSLVIYDQVTPTYTNVQENDQYQERYTGLYTEPFKYIKQLYVWVDIMVNECQPLSNYTFTNSTFYLCLHENTLNFAELRGWVTDDVAMRTIYENTNTYGTMLMKEYLEQKNVSKWTNHIRVKFYVPDIQLMSRFSSLRIGFESRCHCPTYNWTFRTQVQYGFEFINFGKGYVASWPFTTKEQSMGGARLPDAVYDVKDGLPDETAMDEDGPYPQTSDLKDDDKIDKKVKSRIAKTQRQENSKGVHPDDEQISEKFASLKERNRINFSEQKMDNVDKKPKKPKEDD